jgi:hypothetical protein
MIFKIRHKKVNKKEYIIELIEENTVIQTRLATDIIQRDKIIFELADLHNITDIEAVKMDPTLDSKKGKIAVELSVPVIPYVDTFQLENYFDDNNDYIFNRILEAITEGLDNKKKKIKLFQIKNSGIFIDSLKRDWPAGLRVAHEYYTQTEQYTKCAECIVLLKRMKSKL